MPARVHGHNGKVRTKTYDAWAGMHRRCNAGPNWPYHRHYRGRGIKVCARWKSFIHFLADMGECPQGMTLERKDNSKGYSPLNCYWATRKTQMRNTRWNRMLTFQGRTQCISAWVEETGIARGTLDSRLRAGWPLALALTTPTKQGQRVMGVHQ